jgi:hypothetical protein
MAHYPQSAVGLGYVTYPAGPTPIGTSVAAHASNNTKSSTPTELVASTPFAANRVRVLVQFEGDTGDPAKTYLLDLMTGAAAAEVVVVPDLLCSGQVQTGTSLLMAREFEIPLAIPAGTRVSARLASSLGGESLTVVLTLLATGDTPGVSTIAAHGIVAASSRGTAVDPGGAANTKGAIVELAASTSGVTQWLMFMAGLGANVAPSGGRWYFDLMIGGSGSEVVLIPDIPIIVGGTGTSFQIQPSARGFLTYIAASTRISVRASCSLTDGTDRVLSVAVLVAPAPAESGGAGGGGSIGRITGGMQ